MKKKINHFETLKQSKNPNYSHFEKALKFADQEDGEKHDIADFYFNEYLQPKIEEDTVIYYDWRIGFNLFEPARVEKYFVEHIKNRKGHVSIPEFKRFKELGYDTGKLIVEQVNCIVLDTGTSFQKNAYNTDMRKHNFDKWKAYSVDLWDMLLKFKSQGMDLNLIYGYPGTGNIFGIC